MEKQDDGTFGFEIQVGSFQFSRLLMKKSGAGSYICKGRMKSGLESDEHCDFSSICCGLR